MANKRVNLIIALRDGVSSGMDSIRKRTEQARAAINKLGQAGIAMGAAVVAGLGSILKAYSQQESANAKLAATFRALGENGTAAVARWGAFANEIQRVTTVGDETTLSLISLAKTMGINNAAMKDSIRGAIGLSKTFGIDLNSSMKMVALANQGQYEMLGRYIPALRTATTDAEKAAIVQRAMATGFEIAKDEIHTIAGAWVALKNTFGDSMQAIGEAIYGDGGLVTGLTNIRLKMIELAEDGSLQRWGEQTKKTLNEVAGLLIKIVEGWEMLGRAFKKATVFTGTLAANIVNPPREAETMADIWKISAKQTQDSTNAIVSEGKSDTKKVVDAITKPVPKSQQSRTAQRPASALPYDARLPGTAEQQAKALEDAKAKAAKATEDKPIETGPAQSVTNYNYYGKRRGGGGDLKEGLAGGLGRQNSAAGYFQINRGNEKQQLEWAQREKSKREREQVFMGTEWHARDKYEDAKANRQRTISDLDDLIKYLTKSVDGSKDSKNPLVDIGNKQTEYLKRISENVGGIGG